ncbi:MAG: hypothetical protein H7232_05715 [Aeromicrobium sp.]|nr:hypothetical protein [Burkholderiales bacterium]
MRAFSQALTEFPNIQLLQLVWAPAGDANATPLYTVSAAKGTSLLQSVTKAGSTAAGQSGAAATVTAPLAVIGTAEDPVLSDGRFQALVVEAVISPFDGNFRKAIANVNIFVARLNKLPNVSATLIVEPLDVRPSASITSTEAPQVVAPPDARFVLKLVRNMKVSRP